ncbi:hypothetical protein [Roseovarius mucosus]|uniref:hypothetical protein n=1 Tax=Roseovarius mucosus TaxID=215743 RepID=UPI0035CF8F96
MEEKFGVNYHYANENGTPVIAGKVTGFPISVGVFENPNGEPLVTIGDRAVGTVAEFMLGPVSLVEDYMKDHPNASAKEVPLFTQAQIQWIEGRLRAVAVQSIRDFQRDPRRRG